MSNHKSKKSLHPLPTEPALYGDRVRVAFVTGAARGLGRAIALRLAKDGFDVAVNDLDRRELDITKKKIEDLGRKCVALVGDVTDETRVKRMIEEVVEGLGYLDVMVANAGIAQVKPLLNVTTADMDRILRTNVISLHLCYKFAAAYMIKQGTGGKLIGACSTMGYRANPGICSYVASKFAVRGYNQTAALELARYGITANCYAPGGAATRMTGLELATDVPKEEAEARLKAGRILADESVSNTPLKRFGVPEDAANLVSFLASRDSDYITGQSIPVGGGFHML